MRVEVKISKFDGIVRVEKDITVYGSFHIDRLKRWLCELQVSLNLEPPAVPDYPEYASWVFDADLENFTKFELSKKIHTVDSIKQPIEAYYRTLGIENNDTGAQDVVELRYVVWACLRKLVDIDTTIAASLYNKKRAVVSHAMGYVKNRIDTEPRFRKRISDIATIINEPNLIDKLK